MGFELVGDLCLSLSKIITAARTMAEDPAVDGFGHHNPQLGQEDDLFYNTLSIDWFMEGFFRGRDLSTNEAQFFRLMRMGILDGREGYYCHGHGNFQDDFLLTFSFLHVHDPYYPFRLLTNLGMQPGQDKNTVIRTAD